MEETLLTEKMFEPHGTTLTVLVNEIEAKCVIGTFGTYSTRIMLSFETKHPELGKEFTTKYFRFLEPGILGWGHDGKTMKIIVLDRKNPFNKGATVHPFGNQ